MLLDFSDWLSSFLYPLLVVTNTFYLILALVRMYPRFTRWQFILLHLGYLVTFANLALTTGRWPLGDFVYYRATFRPCFSSLAADSW